MLKPHLICKKIEKCFVQNEKLLNYIYFSRVLRQLVISKNYLIVLF